MLHLSPESGLWLPCAVSGYTGKCELKYHAPVEEGAVADSLLWEMYASEELYRESEICDDFENKKEWVNLLGNPHRLYDLPARDYSDGSKEWWVDGERHRFNGPAIEWPSGIKEWWVNGKRHRTDGPAIEYATGRKEWWAEGKRHRADGPAVERANGSHEWWVDGKQYNEHGIAIRSRF